MVNWRRQPRLTAKSDADLARRVKENEEARERQAKAQPVKPEDVSGPLGNPDRYVKDLPNEMPDR